MAPVNMTSDLPVDAVIVAEIELTPEQMAEMEAEAEAIEAQRREAISGLAKTIENKWVRRSSNRQVIEERWRKSNRLYLGNLSSDRGSNNRRTIGDEGQLRNTRPDHNLVKEKCDIAIAQTISQQFAGGDKNWDISPSPRPEMDPAIAQAAAKRLETKIFDQLNACQYGPKARKAMEDRVILGIGVLKGPVPSLEKKRRYDVAPAEDGRMVAIPIFEEAIRPEVHRVDPWMFYPDDSVNDIKDCEDAIEIHPMNRVQFQKLAKANGFFDTEIAEILREGPDEYNAEYFQDVTALTDAGENYLRNKFAVLEYHGPITKNDLMVLGVEPTYDSLDDTFLGEVWVCNGRVIRASLEVIEGAYQLPYMAAVWAKDPNSPFGFSLPLLMEDAQRIHTSTLHMILDNASISGGPQMIINTEYIRPVNNKWEMEPFKIWKSTDSTLQSIDQVVKFFFPPNVSPAIESLLDRAQFWAERESGINLISAGVNSPQTGTDSATGLAILQQQATVVTDRLAEEWDDHVTSPLIERMYHWNILYDLDPDIAQFDFEIDVRSSTELRNKQMQVNNIEKLIAQATQNPQLADWINLDNAVQTSLSMQRLPDTGIVRTPEEYAALQEQKAQQPQPPDPNMVKLEIERGRLEMEQRRLELEAQKLEMEANLKAQQFEIEWQTRQEQNQARREDAQARIIQAEIDREIEMLRLAQRDEESRAKIMASLQARNMQDETAKFLEGMRMNDRAQQRLMQEREMLLKEKTGTGI